MAIRQFLANIDVVENELLQLDQLTGPFREAAENYYGELEQRRLLTYGQQIAHAQDDHRVRENVHPHPRSEQDAEHGPDTIEASSAVVSEAAAASKRARCNLSGQAEAAPPGLAGSPCAISVNGPTDFPSTATPASCTDGNPNRLRAAPLSA